jgi:hypothetical protein
MNQDIPAMEQEASLSFLYDIAKKLEGSGSVVECGSWLGGSIAPVAEALSEVNSEIEIHCYDRWEADKVEVAKAANDGVSLTEGQDTLPIFMNYVEEIYPHIIPHKTDLLEATWTDLPISLFIDDASKDPKVFRKVMNTFGPYFIPDKTVIVLMDYQIHEGTDSSVNRRLRRCQKDFIKENSNSFKKIADFNNSCGVAFKYTNSIDWSKPVLQTPFQRIYASSAAVRWFAWKIIQLENR